MPGEEGRVNAAGGVLLLNTPFMNQMDELIVRYLDGSASAEEEAQLLQWLRQSEDNRNDFLRMRDLWLLCDEASAEDALKRFRCRISPAHHTPFLAWWRAAGIALLCLAAGYGLAGRFHDKDVYVRNQWITAAGSKGRFVLPDGTTVWLNSNSKLTCPEDFREGTRSVALEGEAYFEVARNKEQPFVVHSGGLCVEALGTAFDLANYPADSLIETVLVEGSLRITGDALPQGVVLKPNQRFAYGKEKHQAKLHQAKAGLYIDWIKNRLVFDNDCLADIKISMEGWYNVGIDCPEDFAASTRMSFTVRGESIDEILKAMSFIIPIRYSVEEGGRVKIIPIE